MGQLLPAVDRSAKAPIEDTGGAARQPPPALRIKTTEASASVCMSGADGPGETSAGSVLEPSEGVPKGRTSDASVWKRIVLRS